MAESGLLKILNEELNYLCAIPVVSPCAYIGEFAKRLVYMIRLGFAGVGDVGVDTGDLLVCIAKSNK